MNKKQLSFLATILFTSITSISCNSEELNIKIDEKEITTKRIESIIHEKLDYDIDIEKDINIVDLDGDKELEYVVKYRTQDKEKPLRIMILSRKDDKVEFKDEIKSVGEDFDTVEYIDIDGDGKKEIIAGFKAGENLSKGISIYKYDNGKAIEIFEEYYSEYIIRDITKDRRKEIILIKENEKEDKSFAILYVYHDGKFKKIKKVEINPTLDTKDEIIAKLLED